MNDFNNLDEILTTIENLSSEEIQDGELVELSHYAGAMTRTWGMCADQIQVDLIASAEKAGIKHNSARFDVYQGLQDGLKAAQAFCNTTFA